MNKTQLDDWHNKKKLYHKSYSSSKSFLPLLIFTSISFLFTLLLSFVLLNDNNQGLKFYFNEYSRLGDVTTPFLPDEIIYQNIIRKEALDNGLATSITKHINNPLLLQDRFSTSKFEKFTQNYKDNFSNQSGILEKVALPDDLVSLKKINLLSDISERKKEFINIVLPIIVDQNQKIISLRQRLINSKNYLHQNKTLSQTDQSFIQNLATKYYVTVKNRHKIDIINDLLISVDVIPNSIALAQAANESGWGSSRFATEYNALYGEYTYDSKAGIIPFEREEGKKHLVRYFQTIDKSVESYFMNINSHFAYEKFRKLRKILRDQNNYFNVNLLVDKLDAYAEDDKYVDTLVSIINDNKLTQYDYIVSLLTTS